MFNSTKYYIWWGFWGINFKQIKYKKRYAKIEANMANEESKTEPLSMAYNCMACVPFPIHGNVLLMEEHSNVSFGISAKTNPWKPHFKYDTEETHCKPEKKKWMNMF